MASENALPDNEDVKKKALVRLTVAGLITAAALGALWWLDQGKPPSPTKQSQAPRPVPIRPAEPAASEPPMPELPMEETLAPSPETTPEEAGYPTEAPPPPRVTNAPRAPLAVTGAEPAQASPAPGLPATAPREAPASAKPGNIVVQMGVFSSPARAEALVERLRKQGIRAHTETRVYLGPFMNQQEAEKARAEMQRLGLNGMVTTVAPTK